jgi:hypothetical protein
VSNLNQLSDSKKIIIYSNGSENAAKAAVMLRLLGLDSYLLSGGYNAWQQQVLNPDISAQASDDEAPKVATQRAISCYFSGATESAASPVKIRKREQRQGFSPPLTSPVGCLWMKVAENRSISVDAFCSLVCRHSLLRKSLRTP